MRRLSIAAAGALAAALLPACSPGNGASMVGQLESDRIELAAEFAEPIRAHHVREGERVAAGTLLVDQDDTRMQTAFRETAARVGEAEARLAELLRGPRPEKIRAARAEVTGASEDAAFLRLEYQRALDVYGKKLAAKESVDRAEASRDVAEARLQSSQARLEELLAGTTVEELRQAEQRLEQLRAQLVARQVDLERLQLRAPSAATVDTLLYEPGELPRPGSSVAVLLAGPQPYARVYIPETLRVQVAPGTAATVHVDGLEQPLSGRVRWVSADAAFTPYFALTEHDRGRLSYAAKVDIDFDGKRLPDGVPVQVRLDLTATAGPR